MHCLWQGKHIPKGPSHQPGQWGGGWIRTGRAHLCGIAMGTLPLQGGMHGPGDGWRVLVPMWGE